MFLLIFVYEFLFNIFLDDFCSPPADAKKLYNTESAFCII